MNTKSKTVLAAAFLVASVAGATAFEGPFTVEELNYLRNPNAPVPQFTGPAYAQSGAFQGRVIQYGGAATQSDGYYGVFASDRDALVKNFPGSS